ncbi:MAG: hypothetical protein F6J98_16510 [Moorea sp. SIO4G2]|nr:hypothetical protein [Moorena sp. SIO4G2]
MASNSKGNREQGTGNREQGTGNREQKLSQFIEGLASTGASLDLLQKYFFDTVSLAVGHATRTILLHYSPFPIPYSRQLPRSLFFEGLI